MQANGCKRLGTWRGWIAACALMLSIQPAGAAVQVSVSGSVASAQIELPGGVEAELILTFSNAQNLSPQSLGITAAPISLLDPVLLTRLPSSLTGLLSQLPLLVTIEPPASGGLALSDTVRVELHTELLTYTSNSPYRLFKSSNNGPFLDITDEVAPGSVRTRGTTGGFSQFLIVADLRAPASVVEEKLQRLESRVAEVPLSHRAALAAQLTDVRAAVVAGELDSAIALLDAFRANVSELSGSVIPNVWKADRSVTNVAGELLAGAATLRFSIGTLRGH